ncbi:pilus assembly protein CpaB [Oryzomicrobium terrae]|uniref:Pilus assembly protein CpaB n=1 Tax=Oryzomicrobium terrae TaxID=1735038 RepID=A0A5C1E3X8_9RHOO|nr:Flp pilus assembly protein CpaB [Oryzomicrobium terrae]QEL63553.1 pilus assembly protein CpaB [Oryzomicrobium terrae]
MFAVSLVAGVLAVVAAARWVNQQATGNTNRLAVASVDLQLGQPLNPEMVKLVDWPRDSMPPGAFTEAKDLGSRVTRVAIQRGEPILESKLAPVGSKAGLSAVIASGRRAMTVKVNEVVGVAGFALPGNYVDIMVNTQEEGANQSNQDRQISKIVLERILVLAVAQEASRDEAKPKVVNAVTLEVSPEEAEKLDLARSVGTLSLVLRNQVETQDAKTAGATKQTLLVAQAARTAPAPAGAPASKPEPVKKAVRPAAGRSAGGGNCVKVLTGTQTSQECF